MRYLGTSDEVNACDCCGRVDLKSTVAIETADGSTVYYGVNCAARALKTTAKLVKAGTKAADEARRDADRAARNVAQAAALARWTAFLVAETGGITAPGLAHHGPDIFLMIEALGGFQAARARYKAAA